MKIKTIEKNKKEEEDIEMLEVDEDNENFLNVSDEKESTSE